MNLFMLIRIFPFVRSFLQHIEALGLPIAMANAFEDCNIRMVTRGETTGWNTPGSGIGDINVYGVPIFRALVGAIILVAIWQLLALGLGRGRSRSRAS